MIDAIIALIRASDDAAAAKAGLMAEPFEFTERPGRSTSSTCSCAS